MFAQSIFELFATLCILFIAILSIFCLIRAVRGPRVTDRIVAVNMIGTMTIAIIAILSVVMNEAYLLDVCLIYAMISFLAIVVLTKIYLGVYRARRQAEKRRASTAKEDTRNAE